MSEEKKVILDELSKLPDPAFNHIAEIIHVAKTTADAVSCEGKPCEKK